MDKWILYYVPFSFSAHLHMAMFEQHTHTHTHSIFVSVTLTQISNKQYSNIIPTLYSFCFVVSKYNCLFYVMLWILFCQRRLYYLCFNVPPYKINIRNPSLLTQKNGLLASKEICNYLTVMRRIKTGSHNRLKDKIKRLPLIYFVIQ